MPGLRMTERHFNDTMKEATSGQSILAGMNKFVQAVNEMDETVMIPSKLKDMTAKPSDAAYHNGKALVRLGDAAHMDLYNLHTMLNAIKTELVRGPRVADGDEVGQDDVLEDDLAKQTAEMFRYHLSGLYDVLKQLTGSAHYLTGRYQEEVGDFQFQTTYSVSNGVSPFTI